jgi:hypothetical protein
MRRRTIRTTVIVLIASGLMGCQSGPHWASSLAWWKHDTPPEDASLVARSAAPALPSAQSTPPQMSPAAVPPSAANLAAATSTPATSAPTSPATSLPSTVASTPVASYPTTTSPPTSPAVPSAYPTTSVAAATPPTSPAAGTTPAGVPGTTMAAQAGPYDPNAYRPSDTLSPSAVAAASDDDRYGNSYVDTEPDRYAMTPSSAEPSAPAGDRYAAIPDRYDYQATSTSQPTAATPATSGSVYGDDDRYGLAAAPVTPAASSQVPRQPAVAAATPPASVPTAQYSTTSAASPAVSTVSATVRINTPPGQYRPGGTSSYLVQSPGNQVEVASRPGVPGLPAQ